MLFPDAAGRRTAIALRDDVPWLPTATWVGATTQQDLADDLRPGVGLLVEQAHGTFARPGLRGHRLGSDDGTPIAGRDWSPRFEVAGADAGADRVEWQAVAEHAGLGLRTELETLPGGALRIRHTVTNIGRGPYLLEGLEMTVPLEVDQTEILDFTGRHERERVPQRGELRDGLWLRETRKGRPGLDSPTMLIAGTPGFTFSEGRCVAVHVAWSGNSVLRAERSGADIASVGGGELLLPGEVVLRPDQSYMAPWLIVVASGAGLDPIAHALHEWQRTLPSHPVTQPVTLNVWEAVWFDHSLTQLTRIADLAAGIGVERFVLDDGWFHSRRDDTAGLGDWWVDAEVWPEGLAPLIDRVHALGMEFGLWFEPEMVNPDSDLYREHPDWVMRTDDRVPLEHRNQLVLDLGNPAVWRVLRDRVDAVLAANAVDYVKWDHNRDLLEPGSTTADGAPGAHRNAIAFYELLDDLRTRHPDIAWESCASGGGRIDLGVIEHVQRFWTSDQTDALARQDIQRWTGQLVAPEYLGAHISAPTSHQTGRTLPLDFRAATALFFAFGIEWDLTEAGEDELEELAAWIALHKTYRPLLHTGRLTRIDVADPTVYAYATVSGDSSRALLAVAALDEATHNRGVTLRLPGLRLDGSYRLTWAWPPDLAATSKSTPLHPDGPTSGVAMSGESLSAQGIWLPRRKPETVTLIDIAAAAFDEQR